MDKPILGYCTNVHPGGDLETLRYHLDRSAVGVRQHLGLDVLPIGLWLSDPASEALSQPGEALRFRRWLRERGLAVFTLNGFPQRDFHESTVKHRVYQPAWWQPERLAYTLRLASLLAVVAENEGRLSISTLPIGWRGESTDELSERAMSHLIQLIEALAELERRTHRHVAIDLEPEPGCVLDRSEHVIELFTALRSRSDPVLVNRYLGVCHDICHAAVMREDQSEVIARYHQAGITIGKLQVSSAIKATSSSREALRSFIEPRYLHQTNVTRAGRDTLYEDLDVALAAPFDEARVHFHVPVFLETVGDLGTTRDEIASALSSARAVGVTHFEVETYAWPQLPEGVWTGSLEAGIAEEFRYTQHLIEAAS
ncbi:MAG: metabolite traffic protein EboE [Phycisphaeraceae bacterium]